MGDTNVASNKLKYLLNIGTLFITHVVGCIDYDDTTVVERNVTDCQ
jgi:hypothetical protein